LTTPLPIVTPQRWWTAPPWRLGAAILLLAVVLAEGYVAVGRRTGGDITVHQGLGRAILGGHLAWTFANTKYLLGRHLLSAGVALLPPRVFRGAFYLAAVVLSAGTGVFWHRLARRPGASEPGAAGVSGWAALAATGLLLPWVLRDLDECGLQLILLFFLSAAGLALATGRRAMTGFWLALAVTWKTVPLIFLPLLLWKRRFREALWTLVFVAFFNVAFPILVLGPAPTAEYYGHALTVLRQARPTGDMSVGSEEDPKPQNQGLQMALVRYLVRYPPGHPYFKEVDFLPTHPLFFQPGNLNPAAAVRVALAAMLLLAGLLAWRLRGRWGEGAGQADLGPEWAAVTALTALISPLCWLQHLVLVWPAAFLVLRRMLRRRPSKPILAAVGFVALCTLVLQRGVLTRHLAIVALSYHLPTMAALVLIALVLLPAGPESTA
jgi:hypothetical protein